MTNANQELALDRLEKVSGGFRRGPFTDPRRPAEPERQKALQAIGSQTTATLNGFKFPF